MKNFIFSSVSLLFVTFNVNASINNNYYDAMHTIPYHSIKIQSITNDAITLNTRIDNIDISDPRIKSAIEYAKTHGNGVSIIFFAPDNLRYVKKIRKLFQQNGIYTDIPELATPKHLIDLDLIKIYVIKEQDHEHRV